MYSSYSSRCHLYFNVLEVGRKTVIHVYGNTDDVLVPFYTVLQWIVDDIESNTKIQQNCNSAMIFEILSCNRTRSRFNSYTNARFVQIRLSNCFYFISYHTDKIIWFLFQLKFQYLFICRCPFLLNKFTPIFYYSI